MKATNHSQNELPAIDDLDRAIVNLSARMDADCFEQLALIRQFDERGGWLKWAFPNCTEWLAWRCDLGMSAAREKVRVAHALMMLPLISESFAKGQLSYTKVRALTRVANKRNEPELVSFARKNSAIHVEDRCRELRCGTAASIDDANSAHTRRSLTVRRNPFRGTLTITVELPIETGELIDKALNKARDDDQKPEFAGAPWSAQQADALVAMASAYLNGNKGSSNNSAENYQVTVHVDRSALVEGEGRSSLPIESVKRLCCDSETVLIVEDEDGQPLNVGRKSRTVPTVIKRALWARDKGCAFPGCHRKRFVDAHHIHHWSAGGETSLDNLMLLCSKHHRLVHEGGYRILKDYQDRWCFKRPDGMAVPECGYCPQDMMDDDVDVSSILVKNPSAEGFAVGVV
jgi:Domain of unknown function (DUF222)/HNH endonuclease